ncbi:hypothetical protein [Dietzia psychralcaliphila]|uniref:Uncharacterized protein n=1 Tax=Dietzia psychralcaliphila TaxID=139021 RepID=A0AAD0JSG3_9ACTN|nr:hypothetical protein [Dietzia psychralcaliphila]AWH97055.1 hypothetical protein A6048_00130 [Dietzia psychralcaliphila]PTM89769.1 hypothetical protein C8N39_102615 [Dietzia psychralcaliphila]
MSTRSDRAAERKAIKSAEKDLKKAGTAARKAFDLKDPRFLGEAAVAATRGPAGLALFGASRGIQVLRDRRAEQAEILGNLAADAKQHAEALREQSSVLTAPQEKPKARRRLAPLWIVGLAGGAAVAGAAAYFLRDQGSSAPAASTPSTTPASATTSAPATSSAPAAGSTTAGESETGEDLTIDSPDPDGPADQSDGTTPAAGSAAPGAAAGSAPQPSDDDPADKL